MSRFVLFLFLLLFCNSLAAQKLVFNEVGFKLTDKQREDITLLAGYEAMIYNELFGTTKNDTLTIQINIYKKAGDYKEITQKHNVPKTVLGFYLPKLNQVFVYKHSDFMTTVVHEMGHSFMNNNMSHPPRWLNEGISEFFESLEIVNNQITVYKSESRLRQIRPDLEAFDLQQFLSLPTSHWASGKTRNHMYNVSYSIVLFIMKSRPDNLKRLVQTYKETKNTTKAIEAVYGSVANMSVYYKAFYRNN